VRRADEGGGLSLVSVEWVCPGSTTSHT
jgi:hypothetical protein